MYIGKKFVNKANKLVPFRIVFIVKMQVGTNSCIFWHIGPVLLNKIINSDQWISLQKNQKEEGLPINKSAFEWLLSPASTPE